MIRRTTEEGSLALGLHSLSLSSSWERYADLTTNRGLPGVDSSSSTQQTLDQFQFVSRSKPRGFYPMREQQEMVTVLRSITEFAQSSPNVDKRDDSAASSPYAGFGGVAYQGIPGITSARDLLFQLWETHSDLLAEAAQILADGAREFNFRQPLGEVGVLDFFLIVLATRDVPFDVVLHSLRLVGNVCADVDSNRAKLLDQGSLIPIIKRLQDPALAHVAVSVLFNVCVDYEPAQNQAVKDGVARGVVEMIISQLASKSFQLNLLGSAGRLLEYASSQPGGIDSSPQNIVEVLIRLVIESDLDLQDYITLSNVVVAYLSDIRIQKLLVSHSSVELLLSILVDSCSRLAGKDDPDATPTPSPEEDDQAEASEKSLSQMRNSIIQVLSDISALPEFPEVYPLNCRLVGSLRLWLAAPHSQLQVCACIILGNLARSDDACRQMVHEFRVHEPLVNILRESEATPALHASASFLKNLALLRDNKDTLGETGLVEIVSRLWSPDTLPQLQYSGASLARQLISGSYQNLKCLLKPLSNDPDSPAHSRTYLSLLLGLADRTDQKPTKMEIARTVTAVGRILNAPNAVEYSEEVTDLLHRLFSLHPNVTWPLGQMICQQKWPVVRSEGWFALALMAKTLEGAQAMNSMFTDPVIIRHIVEVVTGRQVALSASGGTREQRMEEVQVSSSNTSDAQEAEMKRIDRENALVLISRLLEHLPNDMAAIRIQLFRDLLNGNDIDYVDWEDMASFVA